MQNRKSSPSKEKRAINILLDCSNTLRLNTLEAKQKKDIEIICPWINKPHINGAVTKNIKHYKRNLFLGYQPWKKPRISKEENCIRLEEATPKSAWNRVAMDSTVYVHKNVVNLTDEFEMIHRQKKESFMRQRYHHRLKTVL